MTTTTNRRIHIPGLAEIFDWVRGSPNPRKSLRALMPELLILHEELGRTSSLPPLDGIVKFFGLVSPWHDRGLGELIAEFDSVNKSKYVTMANLLGELNLHFVSAGRSRYGWNRTEKGETVTPEKVFLGDVYGLFTHPVSYWKKKKDERRDAWKGSLWETKLAGMNSYDVVSRQATSFMQSHARIRSIIYDLQQLS